MKRQTIRLTLAILLVLVTALAAWTWSAGYDREPDEKARFKIIGAQVKRDRSNAWLDVHLRKNGDQEHDFRKPVRLVTADGTQHQPADNTFSGSPETGFTDIWFKFWLEEKDLEGRINLLLNDGKLRVKTNVEPPPTDKTEQVFKSADWKKSWLGF